MAETNSQNRPQPDLVAGLEEDEHKARLEGKKSPKSLKLFSGLQLGSRVARFFMVQHIETWKNIPKNHKI
jgi:hypothetical protein